MRVFRLPETKLGFGLIALCLVAALTSSAPALAERYCEYVPRTVAGADRADTGSAGTYVHLVVSEDCLRQCIGRIYCTESAEEAKTLKLLDKVKAGKVVNCNAVESTSCPTANACMREAELDQSRFAKDAPATPTGKSTLKYAGKDASVTYSADGKTVEATIPKFVFPPKPEEAGSEGTPAAKSKPKPKLKACTFCASPIHLSGTMFGFAVCGVPSSGGCPKATQCADREKDPTTVSAAVVKPDKRKGATPAAEPTSAAPPASRADGGGGGR